MFALRAWNLGIEITGLAKLSGIGYGFPLNRKIEGENFAVSMCLSHASTRAHGIAPKPTDVVGFSRSQ